MTDSDLTHGQNAHAEREAKRAQEEEASDELLPSDEEYDRLGRELHALGAEDGAAAASWYFDGNTELDTYKRVVKMFEEGDPELYDTFPNPLSGEWADDPTPAAILARVGVEGWPEWSDELLNQYEDGYGVAFADTLENDARQGLAMDEQWGAEQWSESVKSVARSLAGRFTRRTRDDGTQYACLTDAADEWMRAVCRAAHDGMLPDDWRYEVIWAAVEFIAEEPDYDDRVDEFADGCADTYNAALVKWLGSGSRFAYVDEAREEFGEDASVSLGQWIQRGQYLEAREVFDIVRRELEANAEEEYERRLGRVAT